MTFINHILSSNNRRSLWKSIRLLCGNKNELWYVLRMPTLVSGLSSLVLILLQANFCTMMMYRLSFASYKRCLNFFAPLRQPIFISFKIRWCDVSNCLINIPLTFFFLTVGGPAVFHITKFSNSKAFTRTHLPLFINSFYLKLTNRVAVKRLHSYENTLDDPFQFAYKSRTFIIDVVASLVHHICKSLGGSMKSIEFLLGYPSAFDSEPPSGNTCLSQALNSIAVYSTNRTH